MGRYLFGAILLAVATLTHGQQGLSLEERLDRLERLMPGQGTSDLFLQLQQLQQEVQQLRGEVEVQRYELNSLTRGRGEPPPEDQPPLSRSVPPMAPAPRIPEPAPADAARDTGASLAAPTPAPGDAPEMQDAYQRGFDLLRRGNYTEAIAAFQAYLERYPDGPQADNAQYWLGEASYVNRDFDTALGEFTQVLERYPRSAKVSGALLKIGYIHYERERWTEARQTLSQLKERYSTSTEARLAQQRLDRMGKEGH